MRDLVRFLFGATLLLFTACLLNAPAFADSETVSGCSGCNGYAFAANLTQKSAGNYSLSYTITDVSGAPATAQSWSLTLFQSGNDITSFSNFQMSDGNTGAYTVNVGKSNNGSNGNCNSSLTDAICVTTSGSGSPSLVGNALTFSFDFTCSNCVELSAWDFLSHGYCTSGSGNCYAISANGSGGVGVPEPPVSTLIAAEVPVFVGLLLFFPKVRKSLLQKLPSLRFQPRLTN